MKHVDRLKRVFSKRPKSSAGTEQGTAAGASHTASTADSTQPRPPPQQEQEQRQQQQQQQKQYGLFEFETGNVQPQPSGPERFPVDIIAVHGLGGHAYKTWTHRATGKLWLRDFLPGLLPGCRVYTFGYPSKLKDVDMCADVQDFGRNLLGSLRDHIEDSSHVCASSVPVSSQSVLH